MYILITIMFACLKMQDLEKSMTPSRKLNFRFTLKKSPKLRPQWPSFRSNFLKFFFNIWNKLYVLIHIEVSWIQLNCFHKGSKLYQSWRFYIVQTKFCSFQFFIFFLGGGDLVIHLITVPKKFLKVFTSAKNLSVHFSMHTKSTEMLYVVI